MRFLYLIQSEKNYHDWEKYNTINRKIILGVWKDPVLEGQINLHGTTTTTGRNKLYQHIKDNGLIEKYDYIGFCDDDIEFSLGSFNDFEEIVLKNKYPLYHATYEDHNDLNGWKWHTDKSLDCRDDVWFTDRIDTCFFSVRNDIIDSIFPFIFIFDKYCWFVACEIFCIVVKNKSFLWAITTNIFVKNKEHREYPRNSFSYQHPKVKNFCKNYIGDNYEEYQNLII